MTTAARLPTPPAASTAPTGPYTGTERRRGEREPALWLSLMLDAVEHGLLLVAGEAQVQFANRGARALLDETAPLRLRGNTLAVHRPQDVAPLFDALAAAQRGKRRLLTLGQGEHALGLSLQPLQPLVAAAARPPLVLVMLGRRVDQAPPALPVFAAGIGLTPAETRVLGLLCEGLAPNAIATRLGVAVSTVRSQASSVRAKAGVKSLRQLIHRVATLPTLSMAPG